MGNLRKGRKRKPGTPQEQQQRHMTPVASSNDPRGVFEGAEADNGEPHPPMTQCPRCHKIIRGPHNGFNPRHKVELGDEQGVYRDSAEARAAGADPDSCQGFSHALCKQHRAQADEMQAELDAIEDVQERKRRRQELVNWMFGAEPEESAS